MPVVKLEKKDFYLIGTEAKQITMEGNKCMVHVGSEYVTIQEFYDRYTFKQCESLYQILDNKSISFIKSITNLLKKHGAK